MMRYSTLVGSAFYRPELDGRVRVTCDGEEIFNVREASDAGGWVVHYPDRNDELATAFGKVVIEILPEPERAKVDWRDGSSPRRKKSAAPKDIDA